MFKAFGRLGSHVRSLNIPIISNLFGSKSRSYNGIENDDEELFVDAQEEIHQDDGSSTSSEHVEITLRADVEDGQASELSTTAQKDGSDQISSEKLVVKEESGKSEKLTFTDDSKVSNEAAWECKGAHLQESDSEHDHSDKKRIVSSKKQTNGNKSSSKSPFKKVHRRISSFTQKQYAKLDALRDDKKDEIKKTSESSDKKDVKENGSNSITNDSVNSPTVDIKVEQVDTLVPAQNLVDIDASQSSHASTKNEDVSNPIVNIDSEKKMISNNQSESKKSGGSSPFKKVHRRISSYTQRQYSKMDSTGGENEHNESVLKIPGTANGSDVKLNVCHSFADMSDLEKLRQLKYKKEIEEKDAFKNSDSKGETKKSDDTDTDDEHDVSDKKRIVSSSKPNNGKQSLSPSPFKKVHRRINSFTQRQYAKFDESGPDDGNDSLIANVPEAADDTDAKTEVFHSIEEIPSPQNDKKPKKRKKVAVFQYIRGLLGWTNSQKK